MPLSWPDARHIYLSPHLDDAVLSCGGLIAEQAHAGQSVAVITVFAASPPPGAPLSPFARALHDRWAESARADSVDPAAVRRAEDVRALAALGDAVQPVHYTLPDCIYRLATDSGEPLYASEEAIFGEVHPADPALADLRATPPPPPGATVYAPLAIGQHVDHQLIYQVVRGWGLPRGAVRYYEDYPYVTQQREPIEVLLAQRGDWQPQVAALSERALEAKVRAAAAYQSQISTFWPDVGAMAEALHAYASDVGGERLWRPAGG